MKARASRFALGPLEALKAEAAQAPKVRDFLAALADDKRARLLEEVAALVALMRPGGQWYVFQTQRHIRVTSAKKKSRELLRAVTRVRDLVADREVAALLTTMGTGIGVEAPQDLAHALRALDALHLQAAKLARDLAPLRGARPGAPPNRWRHLFARGVCAALERAGERPTKADDGIFARLLDCAFKAAGDGLPADRRALLKPAVDAGRRG